MDKGINVYIAKQNMQLDGSIQAKITATILGLAAEIEREFISMRTKEALAAKKAKGMELGRSRGPAPSLYSQAGRQTKANRKVSEIRSGAETHR